MRGDRPSTRRARRQRPQAAPHARGSTHRATMAEPFDCGCPACAGIDPRPREPYGIAPRLPRMRGDRPAGVTGEAHLRQAAPHARGSTRATRAPRGARRGCPACAGIDPRGVLRALAHRRLPRMRGDRPGRCDAAVSELQAAPHARGSTPLARHRVTRWPGCPACAGIDPVAARSIVRPLRLPRMRGDRPQAQREREVVGRAAPHARGSTLALTGLGRLDRGCPACAGIDPVTRLAVIALAWLPRMRGDRPLGPSTIRRLRRAAPHARGSTFSGETSLHRRVGCPACAGIDPCRTASNSR